MLAGRQDVGGRDSLALLPCSTLGRHCAGLPNAHALTLVAPIRPPSATEPTAFTPPARGPGRGAAGGRAPPPPRGFWSPGGRSPPPSPPWGGSCRTCPRAACS